jgi:hypothetical protein
VGAEGSAALTRPTRTEGSPHDRSTRLCDAALNAIQTHPDYNGEKLIVFLNDGERSGIGLTGYEQDSEAMADLLIYLRAIFKANGKTLLIAPLGQG